MRRVSSGSWLLLGLLAACGGPATGALAPDFVRTELHCDYGRMVERSEELRAERPPDDPYFEPSVGWNACTLLLHNGPPDRADREERDGGPVLVWRYGDEPDRRVVGLQRRGCGGACGRNESPWRVTYVRW